MISSKNSLDDKNIAILCVGLLIYEGLARVANWLYKPQVQCQTSTKAR